MSILSHALQHDDELLSILKEEGSRQMNNLTLIASENYAGAASRAVLSSVITNKYAEGYPNARYYGGCEVIDKLEELACSRVLEAFRLDPSVWDVNVQAHSGSEANFSILNAFLNPGDRFAGIDLVAGGHLSHGHRGARAQPVSVSGKYFDVLSFGLPDDWSPESPVEDFEISYEKLLDACTGPNSMRPKLILAGVSAYPRKLNWERLRAAARASRGILVADISHIAGMVAGVPGFDDDVFKYADVVMSTTHKTLGGPRGAVIFSRKPYTNRIRRSVFPGLQGGPHMHTVAGIAASMKEASSGWTFRFEQRQTLELAQSLGRELRNQGIPLLTGGTDCHYVVADVGDGLGLETVLGEIGLTVNKNSLPGDRSVVHPRGIRLGCAAVARRALTTDSMADIANAVGYSKMWLDRLSVGKQPTKARERVSKLKMAAREELDRGVGDLFHAQTIVKDLIYRHQLAGRLTDSFEL